MKTRLTVLILLIPAVISYFVFKKPEQMTENHKGRNMDESGISQLRHVGSNLEKPHEFDFYLYFPSHVVAKEADAEIRKAGYTTVIRPAASGSQWLCLASKTVAHTPTELSDIEKFFDDMAKKFDGEYDGWEAKVEK